MGNSGKRPSSSFAFGLKGWERFRTELRRQTKVPIGTAVSSLWRKSGSAFRNGEFQPLHATVSIAQLQGHIDHTFLFHFRRIYPGICRYWLAQRLGTHQGRVTRVGGGPSKGLAKCLGKTTNKPPMRFPLGLYVDG